MEFSMHVSRVENNHVEKPVMQSFTPSSQDLSINVV